MRIWVMAAAVAAADQGAKFLVQAYLPEHGTLGIWPPYLSLTHVQNPGGAFGILAGRGPMIVLLSLLVIFAIVLFSRRITSAGYTWDAGLILGGTVGNLIDRLRLGRVVDFIDFSFWPAFNIADIALTAGVLLMLWHVVENERRRGAGCS